MRETVEGQFPKNICGQSIVIQPDALFYMNIQVEQVLPDVVASAHPDIMFLFVPINFDIPIVPSDRTEKIQFIESLPVGIDVGFDIVHFL